MDRLLRPYEHLVKWCDALLAVLVFSGVVIYAIGSMQTLVVMDWRITETYYELIFRVLLLVIGLELMRTLMVRDLIAVLDLLAFVVARKMLKPDLTAIDIALSTLAFVSLLIARYFLIVVPTQKKHEKSGVE